MSDKVLSLHCKRRLFKKQLELTEELLARYSGKNKYQYELLRPYTLRYAYAVVYAEFHEKCLVETLLCHIRFINKMAQISAIDKNTVQIEIKGVLPQSIAWGSSMKGHYNFHVRREIFNKLGLAKAAKIIQYTGFNESTVIRQIEKIEDVNKWYSALMPYEYTDGLHYIEDMCFHGPDNKVVYSSHGFHDNFMSHVICLYMRMYKNWRISLVQHGGTYLLMKNFITLEAEKSYSSEHIYWGKLGSQYSALNIPYSKRNFLVLKCIRLMRYFVPKFHCIIALPAQHDYDYRFDDFFQSSAYDKVVGEIERALVNIPRKYALHPYNKLYSEEFLQKNFIKLKLFKKNLLFGLLLSRVILIPYNGTVIHEALVSRCPFLIYINEERDGFDLPGHIKTKMLDLNILHTSEQSLSDFMIDKKALRKWLVDRRVINTFNELRQLLVEI